MSLGGIGVPRTRQEGGFTSITESRLGKINKVIDGWQYALLSGIKIIDGGLGQLTHTSKHICREKPARFTNKLIVG